ncbi:hypothetical protein SJ05684_b56390 (plasmid) [Sinorhizobium sojae CCBAU 05684]|uniref:Uncharacterized protein n=1 Tax=Sinorhizobium sojae CCBAU 05684 TaxID=716928 RepID=A0A249PL30_9HYPH|nr:hypothetical protein SJ05684_b56390 [Sinorhizobium sojae CCBAU 05684]
MYWHGGKKFERPGGCLAFLYIEAPFAGTIAFLSKCVTCSSRPDEN